MKKNIKNQEYSNNIFGFWIYIMSDCILFATLFSVYNIFNTHIFGGLSPKDLFNIKLVFIETILLLLSSFTFGVAKISTKNKLINKTTKHLLITFILGLSFVGIEIYEFYSLYYQNQSWQESAFLSSFFALVGTHGAHIIIGLIWIVTVIFQININKITKKTEENIKILGIFWHFLDIVWIFIFSTIYLMGVI